jgi:hypothetical protein
MESLKRAEAGFKVPDLCDDPLKICSVSIPTGRRHERDDGRRIQALDSQARDATGFRYFEAARRSPKPVGRMT